MLRLRGWLPRSLVGRVYALYTVTLVGFVLAGLAVFYQFQFSADLEEAQTRTEGLSAVLMPTVSDSAVIGDYDTIRRTLERAVAHSAFSAATFIDLRGGVGQTGLEQIGRAAGHRLLAVEDLLGQLGGDRGG